MKSKNKNLKVPLKLTGFKVICEACKQTFQLVNGDLRQKRVEADLYHVYYVCKECGHIHVVCKLNKELVALQRTLAYLKQDASKAELVKQLSKEYKVKLDILNDKTPKHDGGKKAL
jgi:hypothetical protein